MSVINVKFCVTLISTFMIIRAMGYSLSDVKRLKKELLNDTNYDKSLRPSLNQTKPTEVCIIYFNGN